MKTIEQNRMQEIVEEVKEIRDEIKTLVSRLSSISNEVGDEIARAYLIAALEIPLGMGSWLSNDMTINDWVARLQEQSIPEQIVCKSCGYEGMPEMAYDENDMFDGMYCPDCNSTNVEAK